jgi:hypothetical protein
MQVLKICTFSNILQKVTSYFFANIYHSPFDPIEIPKKFKIEAPYPTTSPHLLHLG